MDVIQEFEEWSGMSVNTFKTKQMTVDVVRGNRATTEKVTYNKEILLIVPESEPVRYLGFWATPNGNLQAAKDLVYERTLVTKETIRDHPFDPKQVIEIFSVKARELPVPSGGEALVQTTPKQTRQVLTSRIQDGMETKREHG